MGLAASGGLLAASCQEPVRFLSSGADTPESGQIGESLQYATLCRECPAGCGVLARVVDGRPVKLEGNPRHPTSGGALCAHGQGALLTTYNPERLRRPLSRRGERRRPLPWRDAIERAGQALADARGRGLGRAVFWSGLETGTLADTHGRLSAALGGQHLMTEPTVSEALLGAYDLTFGRRDLPRPALDAADLVVALEADLFNTYLSPVELARQIVGREGGRATLVWVGPTRAGSALLADRWVPALPGASGLVALAALERLARPGGRLAGAAEAIAVARDLDGAALARAAGVEEADVDALARAIGEARRPVVLPPGALGAGADGLASAAAAVLLGATLGVYEGDLRFGPRSAHGTIATVEVLRDVIDRMHAGQVDVLVVAGANPLFDLPESLGLREAFDRVGLVVVLAERLDATAEAADLVIPVASPLESWGDYTPWEGIEGLLQPVLRPLFGLRSTGDTLLALADRAGVLAEVAPAGIRTFEGAVRARWLERLDAQGRADAFTDALRQGGAFEDVATTRVEVAQAAFDTVRGLARDRSPASRHDGLVLAPYAPVGERFDERAPGGWLDELPEPATSAVWGPPVIVHPDDARRLGLEHGGAARVATDHGAVELPVAASPAVRTGVVAVPVSGGARRPGQRFSMLLGRDALLDRAGVARAGWPVRASAGRDATARLYVETKTFDQNERGLMRAGGIDQPREEHELEPRRETDVRKPHTHTGQRWGMAIDLDLCTGCSACIVACQAENNVAVVGPERVEYGREMHWLQLHLYWEEDRARRPIPVYGPVPCMHCDIAPCESVCPVYAPYHTPDGLNAQIYNRCIGTRYCNNNCPYKVRRFNWFRYEWPDPLQLQLNPDVTVRGAGVMEKCTFCVQRIRLAQEQALLEGRPVRDGEIKTACQQTCPTGAILFGDLLDPESAVSRRARSRRAYRMLEHLGTEPGVHYLEREVR